MNDLGHVLLGAILVTIGILAAALADRIRGIRLMREVSARRDCMGRSITTTPATVPTAPSPRVSQQAEVPRRANKLDPPKTNRSESRMETSAEGGEEVVAALVAAGYTKAIATEAAWGCSAAERGAIEEWTRAALRRCVRGGMS